MTRGQRLRRAMLAGALTSLTLQSAAGAQQPPATPSRSGFAPSITPVTLGAAAYAKILCSAVFVSGRDPDEARRNSTYFLTPPADRDAVTNIVVDRDQRLVRVTVRAVTRTARFYGDQGCIIHPEGTDSIFFTPVPVRTLLPAPDTQPWPMGDVLPVSPLPPELDKARLDAAVDLAFSDPEALTAAVAVVYKGRLVAERYMPGITPETQLESWSMGKSLTATLVGLLVRDGVYTLEQPAPVPDWQRPGDPRASIRIMDLLRMSSGLRCLSPSDPDYSEDKGYPDHVLVYTGAIDAFRLSISRPLQFPPNTEGRYRNCDPLTLGYLVQRAVVTRGEEYLTYPQRALFDKIGIRRQVLETDPYGNFLLTGYDYGTARNWARLGLLYLQNGVWQGTRLLPEGWAKFVSTPAPAWKRPEYGGLFWVNGTGAWKMPRSAYMMNGAGGQRVIIIPEHDLVIVRLGHQRGERVGMQLLNDAVASMIAAVGGSRPSAP